MKKFLFVMLLSCNLYSFCGELTREHYLFLLKSKMELFRDKINELLSMIKPDDTIEDKAGFQTKLKEAKELVSEIQKMCTDKKAIMPDGTMELIARLDAIKLI